MRGELWQGLRLLRSFEDDTPINFNPHHSWLGLTEQQNLTLFRGRAWMPEVERPKFRKDAKQTERSLKGKVVGDLLHFAKLAKHSLKGKGVGARRGIVRMRNKRSVH